MPTLVRRSSAEEFIGLPVLPVLPDYEADETMWQRLALWRVLANLGAYPFTPESVNEYETHKAKEANASLLLEQGAMKRRAATWKRLAYVFLGAIILPLLPFLNMTEALTPILAVGVLYAVCIIGSASAFCLLKNSILERRAGLMRSWYWQTIPLDRYMRIANVPPDVVALAEAVVREMPSIQPHVRVLSNQNLLGDPFLVIRHQGSDLFVAVWEEEGYPLKI